MKNKMVFNFDEVDLNSIKSKEQMNVEEQTRYLVGTWLHHVGNAFEAMLKKGFVLEDIVHSAFTASLSQSFTKDEETEYNTLLIVTQQMKNQGRKEGTVFNEDIQRELLKKYGQLKNSNMKSLEFSVRQMFIRLFPEKHPLLESARIAGIKRQKNNSENELTQWYIHYNYKRHDGEESDIDKVCKIWENSINRESCKFKEQYQNKIDLVRLDYKTIQDQDDRIAHLLKVIGWIEEQLKPSKHETISEVIARVSKREAELLGKKPTKNKEDKGKKTDTKDRPNPTAASTKAEETRNEFEDINDEV